MHSLSSWFWVQGAEAQLQRDQEPIKKLEKRINELERKMTNSNDYGRVE